MCLLLQVTPAGTDIQVPTFNGSKNKDSSNPSRKSLMLPLRGGGANKQNENARRYTREQLMSYRSLRASNIKPKIPSSVDMYVSWCTLQDCHCALLQPLIHLRLFLTRLWLFLTRLWTIFR